MSIPGPVVASGGDCSVTISEGLKREPAKCGWKCPECGLIYAPWKESCEKH